MLCNIDYLRVSKCQYTKNVTQYFFRYIKIGKKSPSHTCITNMHTMLVQQVTSRWQKGSLLHVTVLVSQSLGVAPKCTMTSVGADHRLYKMCLRALHSLSVYIAHGEGKLLPYR